MASAGTIESSDVLVTVAPHQGLDLSIQSSVWQQYGLQIEAVVHGVLNQMGVSNAKITLNDQGALDCTIKARLETAVLRATNYEGEIKWGEVIA